jgi:hypothetical protein
MIVARMLIGVDFNFLPQFGQAVADAETCFPQSVHGASVGVMVLVFLSFLAT